MQVFSNAAFLPPLGLFGMKNLNRDACFFIYSLETIFCTLMLQFLQTSSRNIQRPQFLISSQQNCSEGFLIDAFLHVLHIAGSRITLSLAYKYFIKLLESPSGVECKVHVIRGCWQGLNRPLSCDNFVLDLSRGYQTSLCISVLERFNKNV